MTELRIAMMDQGGANARILARETKADFRRIEAASLKMPVRFVSAEGKRFFVRYFSTLQLNAHFMSTIARTALDHADIARLELALREQIDALNNQLNQAIDGAEVLFKLHGIASVATYDTLALEGEIGVMSSLARRFLEGIAKFDQLMPLLQTLEIHEVITTQAVDQQRATLKRQVRNTAGAARSFALRLRRMVNAAARPAATPRSQVRGDAIASGVIDDSVSKADEHAEQADVVAEVEVDAGADYAHPAL